MANIERRVSVLEGGVPTTTSPLLQLRDQEAEKFICRLCAGADTTLEKEIERHGGQLAFIHALIRMIETHRPHNMKLA